MELQVTLHGLVADHQLGGDGAVGQPVDHKRQDLAFPLRQPLPGAGPELVALHPRGRVDRPGRHPGVDSGLAAVHEFELAHQLVAADAFQQVSRRADAQRLEEVLLVVVDRQHHDLEPGGALAQLCAQVQATGALHPHVAEHDVGFEFVDDAERTLSADHVPDHLHAVLEGREHGFESLDDHLVVVHQHNSHWHGHPIDPRVASLLPGHHGTTLELAFPEVEELGIAVPPIGGG